MNKSFEIFDAHAHIIYGINGIKRGQKTATAKYGRILWNNKEINFLPPFFYDTQFTSETLIENMDFCGESKTVLLQNPVIGILNNEIQQAIEKYLERFFGTIQVDPLKKDASDVIQKYASEKQNTLKLEIGEEWGWSGNYPDFSLLAKEMMSVWETVANIPDEFHTFWNKERDNAIVTFSQEDNLDSEKLEKIIGNYLFTEKLPLRDDVIGVMKTRPSLKDRNAKAERVTGKILTLLIRL